MDAVRRFVILLLGLALAGLAVLAAVMPQDLADTVQDWVGLLARAAGAPDQWVVVATLGVLAFLLLLLALAGGRARGLLVTTDAGTVELQPAMVAGDIRRRLEALDGVRTARVDVAGRGRRADVRALVDVDEAALGGGLAPRLAQAVRDAVEGASGLKLGRLRLDVRQAPTTVRDESARRAA